MASTKVELKSVAVLQRDPETNHVKYRDTLDNMAQELHELRQHENDNESLRAENAGLKQALTTLEAMFKATRIPAVTVPQLEEKVA